MLWLDQPRTTQLTFGNHQHPHIAHRRHAVLLKKIRRRPSSSENLQKSYSRPNSRINILPDHGAPKLRRRHHYYVVRSFTWKQRQQRQQVWWRKFIASIRTKAPDTRDPGPSRDTKRCGLAFGCGHRRGPLPLGGRAERPTPPVVTLCRRPLAPYDLNTLRLPIEASQSYVHHTHLPSQCTLHNGRDLSHVTWRRALASQLHYRQYYERYTTTSQRSWK